MKQEVNSQSKVSHENSEPVVPQEIQKFYEPLTKAENTGGVLGKRTYKDFTLNCSLGLDFDDETDECRRTQKKAVKKPK